MSATIGAMAAAGSASLLTLHKGMWIGAPMGAVIGLAVAILVWTILRRTNP
jgi:hypothetical protein